MRCKVCALSAASFSPILAWTDRNGSSSLGSERAGQAAVLFIALSVPFSVLSS